MSDIHISESVFTQSFLRNLTVSTNVKATFHRHLSGTRSCDLPSSGTSDGMSPHPPAEGADESDISSSPSCTRSCGLPSSGTSDGHVTSSPRRRCRRKHRFIVTFPALAAVVSRPQAPLTALSPHPPQKVPTKATFHRHLSGTRNCDLPSSGTSDGHVTSSPRRRCRRKRHFIVTFRHSQPWYSFISSLFSHIPFTVCS